MTYPAPQYPPQQAPAWPPAPQPQYGQPVYPPQSPYAPAPQYGAPQGFGQPAYGQPTPPAQEPLAQVSIDDFYSAPPVGKPSWSWKDKPLGTTYIGVVSGPPTARQNTDMNGKPLFFNDGRPMPIMTVPMQVQPSAEFPNGEASWLVNVRHRDELARAMGEAGVSNGVPEVGAVIQVTLTERRANRSGNPSNIVQVRYASPGGQPVAPPIQPTPQPQYAPQPDPAAQQYMQQQPMPEPAPQPQYAPPAQPAPAPQAAPAPAAQPAQQLAMPADFSPEQQALMARLTGQQG